MKPAFKLPERKVEQWVAGGGEGAPPKVKLSRLTIDLDPDLHARFKAACAMGRTRMIDEVRDFIESYVQKHG
jgi:hypothetical protein